jgi:hypothetical protein
MALQIACFWIPTHITATDHQRNTARQQQQQQKNIRIENFHK